MLERLQAHADTLDLLQTIPGIDRLAAASMLVEIGPDMSAFGSAHAFAAWAGLSPGNHESAGKRRRSATREGSRHLRAAFVEAAHGAVRTHNCQFEGFYRSVAARRGSKRSIVATAHKMARILYVMLRDRVPYRDPGTDHELDFVQNLIRSGSRRSRFLRWFRGLHRGAARGHPCRRHRSISSDTTSTGSGTCRPVLPA